MSKYLAAKIGVLSALIFLSFLAVSATPATLVQNAQMENLPKISFNGSSSDGAADLIIETYTNDYSSLIDYITQINGTVRYTYKYVKAVAVTVPEEVLPYLIDAPNVASIHRDVEFKIMSLPQISGEQLDELVAETSIIDAGFEALPLKISELERIEPNTYWNLELMNAWPLWSMGYYGNETLAVIIDTGIWTDHFMFYGTDFLGGIDMSFDNHTICEMYGYYPPWYCNETFLGWDNPYNHWHGSHVAGILAGFGAIAVPEDHILVEAIEMYTGVPLPSAEPYGYPGYKLVILAGMAPETQLYIIKVFDHTGAGVPESLVMMAIEHAINLKLERGYDVDLISMSLGGPTLYDGRDPFDRLIDYATSVGITVVAAAGNDGPAMMTTASPGSAYTSITVGAAVDPVHARVFWDYYYGYLGLGWYLYRTDEKQIIYFSSRGPTSDGRVKPTISAPGTFILSAYPTGGVQYLAFASGTSMSWSLDWFKPHC